MCPKNYLLPTQQKYSVEIGCLSFQQNQSLNIFLTEYFSNILVFQKKHFIIVIQQKIREIYGYLTGVFSYIQMGRKC